MWVLTLGVHMPHRRVRKDASLDHVVAVSSAVDELVKQRGGSVHLIGYSLGGMFIYQAAAFRRCKDIASLITMMGSPVDILRNFPILFTAGVLSNLLHAAEEWCAFRWRVCRFARLDHKLGFQAAEPATGTASPADDAALLDDEEALKSWSRRDVFSVVRALLRGQVLRCEHLSMTLWFTNRMMSGGFVIAGQTVSLADLSVPILHFRGSRDDFLPGRAVCPRLSVWFRMTKCLGGRLMLDTWVWWWEPEPVRKSGPPSTNGWIIGTAADRSRCR